MERGFSVLTDLYHVPVFQCNVTHVGEHGYVMYIPNEFALHVFEALVEAGEEFDIKQCGYYAMRALRIEKFYAFWGQVCSHTLCLFNYCFAFRFTSAFAMAP